MLSLLLNIIIIIIIIINIIIIIITTKVWFDPGLREKEAATTFDPLLFAQVGPEAATDGIGNLDTNPRNFS